jgi:WD40 repeat protein
VPSARTILAILLLVSAASAGERRVDLDGDPLPPGALARFGTSRLRHPGIHGEDTGFAFRPDSKAIASLDELSVRLWDVATGKMLWRFDAKEAFTHVAFSPDGKRMVLCCNHPLILDATTGKLERTLKASAKNSAAFSPDGGTLATARFDWGESIELWNVTTGERLSELPIDKRGKPQELAFTPDGKTLRAAISGVRAGSASVTVASWDVGTRKRGTDFDPNVRLATYRMSEDGRLLGTRVSHIEKVQLWDIATGRSIGEVNLTREHFNFAPDSKTLVTFVANRPDRTVVIGFWDTATCKKIREIKIPSQLGEEARLSPDGKVVATSKRGQMLCLWDAQNGRRLHEANGHSEQVTGVDFANDGAILVSSGGGEVRTWDASNSKMLGLLPSGSRWVSLMPNGRELLVEQGGLRRIDVLTSKPIGVPFSRPTLAGRTPGSTFRLYRAIPTSDGRTVLGHGFVDEPGLKVPTTYVVVWEVMTGKIVVEYVPTTVANIEAVSCDGRTAITSETTTRPNTGANKNYYPTEFLTDMQVLDVLSGRKLVGIRLPEMYRYHALISPDGQTLATITGQNGPYPAHPAANLAVRLWEIRTGRERATIPLNSPGHYDPHAPGFSADGRLVAVSRTSNRLEVFEAATGREFAVLQGFESSCYTLTFSADGRRLASGHVDGTILVWEIPELKSKPIDAAAIDAAWKDLASEDAARANTASWELAWTPASVKLLAAELKPADGKIVDIMRTRIAELDSKSFQVREKASRELAVLIDQADGAQLKSLTGNLSDEQASRIKRILETPAGIPASEFLRTLRGIETLERMGTKEAAAVLRKLADGPAEMRVTREAKDALGRLARTTTQK